jgi:hypothetical protein
MYGYDTFVLDDNQYGDSFYSSIADSIQMQKPMPPPIQVPAKKEGFSGARFVRYDREEVADLKFQIYLFYILLVAAVMVIVTQRMTINTMQQIMFMMKPGSPVIPLQ